MEQFPQSAHYCITRLGIFHLRHKKISLIYDNIVLTAPSIRVI